MAKTQIKNYVFKPGLGAADNLYPNAYSLITANKSFIQKEATAWIQTQVDAGASGFVGYTYNQAKCERDVGYVVEAYLKDLRYGGNETVRKTIKYYWDQDVAQVDGDRQPEIQTHTFISTLIRDNILPKVAYAATNTEVDQVLSGEDAEALQQFTPTGATYKPTTGVMTLTIGAHTLSVGSQIHIAPAGITFTCSLDANATLHPYPRGSGVPNATGRDPFYYTPVKITATTATTITVNIGISSDTSTHTFNSAVANSITAGPSAVINTLAFNTVDVITNGLNALPTLVSTGVGTVKFQGAYELEELLLITNVTSNDIIYNFSSPATGGLVSLKTDKIETDPDFVTYLQTTDAITTVTLNYNTSGHADTDDLQIFVEKLENGKSVVTTRPFDFGTDAIERMRVAPAVSMLDADFEYGLQPTKWAAIAALRGYPSVYEIPGTDTPVLTVESDASAGTEGIGQSLITVNTIGAHGFTSGIPITIKALEDSVVGAARAEGSFVIVNVPSPTSFQYYAKSKVGTVNPSTLSTTYTQLRQAGFYTGATIGAPDFAVVSQGSNGVMSTQLSVAAGNTIIPFDGLAPEVGSPLTQSDIPVGSQVTGIIDTSAGGGTYLTPVVTANAAIGDSQIFVEDSTGIINNLAADRGDGTAMYVNNVQPTFIEFDDLLTAPVIANKKTYTGITGSNVDPSGTGATFDVTLSQDAQRTYNVAITAGGTAYAIGDRILLDGLDMGGQSGINDALLQVTGVGSLGELQTFSTQGAHWDGNLNLTNQTGTVQGHAGTGAKVDLSFNAGSYTSAGPSTGTATYTNPLSVYNSETRNYPSVGSSIAYTYNGASGTGAIFTVVVDDGNYSVTTNVAGSDYVVNETFVVAGNLLGGATPTNDLTITVSAENAGAITGITSAGTALIGSGVSFSIDRSGSAYTVNILAQGTDYRTNETIDVPGSFLDGTSPANDATITINTIGVNGQITGATVTGTALNTADASSGYAVNDGLVIPGSELQGGADGINDVYLQVTSVNAGAITGLSFSGTPPIVSRTYNGVNSSIAATYTGTSGTGAIFGIQSVNGAYAATTLVAGIDYQPTETYVVAGDLLGGTTPANDATITIDNVGGTGDITAISITGTGSTAGTFQGKETDNRIGSAGTFDVSISGGNYAVTVNQGGQNYGTNQTILLPGNLLSGTSPANDLTITVSTIDTVTDGAITAVTSSGTVATVGGTYTTVTGNNLPASGSGAIFDVNKLFATYDSISITNGGASYFVGDKIEVLGTDLDGTLGTNDIVITVAAVGVANDITSITYDYQSAEPGVNLDLISTVLMTEATTGTIPVGTTISYSALATIETTFTNAHGLVPGSTFITSIDSDNGPNNHKLVAGSYIATDIPAVNKLRFQVRAPGAIDISQSQVLGQVYPRPDSFFVHRPFDGGVQLGTGGPQHGAQAIRQSKKYIRYQSGKGIMYTTGALFAPSYDIRSLTAEGVEVGSLITVVTDDNDHGVQVGGTVRILGVETPGFNSGPETAVPPVFDYTVEEIVDERTYKVRAVRRLGSTNAVLGFGAQMSVISWHGATVRSGIFDDQNGIFWEFDGTQISVVQRTGTRQLAGTISIDVDSNLITGSSTRFQDQLKAGDRIIIKGMTHVVSHVNSQTEITVTPDFRGVVNITGAKSNLIVDKKVKQRDFNLDKLDGTGPSGYNIDIAKMQMIGIQYSWYGAGFIDFMLRGSDGNFVFAHRMRNSNVNTEAFMRSGNLPVRYEVTNEGPSGKLALALNNSATELTLEDTSFFPSSGTIYIDNEIMTFTGKNDVDNKLTGLTRGATFTNFQAGSTRSYTAGAATTHVARTGVVLISQTITPLISHWGSAFITDGGFDEDRGYIFSYAETAIEVSTTKQTAFMIRLSPSVSNALIGDLGERELLNRAQLLLQGLEITSEGQNAGTAIEGGIVVEGILNPQNYPLNPVDVGWSGLSSLAQGGQPSFAQVAAGGSVVWSSDAAATTALATAQGDLTTTFDIRYGSGNNRNYVYARKSTWDASDAQAGDYITSSPNASWGNSPGIRISRVDGPYGGGGDSNRYYVIRLGSNYSGSVNGGNTLTVTRPFTVENRNTLFVSKASFDTTGAKVGTNVSSGGTVTVPANTLINTITLEEFNGTEYYEISFNNNFNGELVQGSGTVQFEFVQPPFAQPGETVFSFIANPGERSTLDLGELKELTNTPLGGRGTYPNGPDVLGINVYKVSGAATTANIILRWGEAQA